jgi:tRNA(Arg) A34 adenosine deaminase TadA
MTDTFTDVVIDSENQKPVLSATKQELKRLLETIETDILPKTVIGVENGNKVFGAAILDENFKTFLAETNNEMDNPLFHGEVNLINQWAKAVAPSERGKHAQQSIFLSTHEPCCMCISSIVWTGFRTIYYLFPYSITSAQGIPYDVNIMHELWGVSSYRKNNKFCSTACIMDLINDLPDSDEDKKELIEIQNRLIESYDSLASKYHQGKTSNKNNSLVMG